MGHPANKLTEEYFGKLIIQTTAERSHINCDNTDIYVRSKKKKIYSKANENGITATINHPTKTGKNIEENIYFTNHYVCLLIR